MVPFEHFVDCKATTCQLTLIRVLVDCLNICQLFIVMALNIILTKVTT